MNSKLIENALTPLAKLIARELAAEILPLLSPADDIVSRKTCRYSKRWWDRNAGVTFPVFMNGREKVGKRANIDAAFEREAKLAPKAQPVAPRDEEEAELEAAGIHLVGGSR
jgi:hypothetical protein